MGWVLLLHWPFDFVKAPCSWFGVQVVIVRASGFQERLKDIVCLQSEEMKQA